MYCKFAAVDARHDAVGVGMDETDDRLSRLAMVLVLWRQQNPVFM